jgi:HK97 family phage major capsid protein
MLIYTPERKEMATDTATAGGYRTLKTISGKILENLFEMDPIRANANVEPPISGDVWQGGWDDDAMTTGAAEEGSTRSETATDTIGVLEIPVKERYAKPVTTQRMLDMGDFDVEAWLNKKLSRKFAYQEGYDFLLGDGVSSAEGLLTNATLLAAAQHSGQAANLPVAASFDLFFTGMAGTVKMGYHADAKWYMNRTTLFKMLTYKYADGRYILQMAMNPGKLVEWAFLGYPIIECPSWPSEGAGNMVLGFGSLREAYTIVDNPKMTILRDPYTPLGKVGFYTTRYVGGKVVKPEAFKLMECAA